MEAVAWSLFGLTAAGFATVVTAVWRLAARIDDVRRDLGARMDAQTGRIDAMNTRMDAHIHSHAG